MRTVFDERPVSNGMTPRRPGTRRIPASILLLGLLVFASACGERASSMHPSRTKAASTGSPPEATGPAPGDLVPLLAYPKKIPPPLQFFPPSLVYAGQAALQGQGALHMSVIRFGEGHPAFKPSIVMGSPGQRIELAIENQTPVIHNFTTLDQKIDRNIGIGETVTFTVTFPQKGVLIFYCKYHLVDFQLGELVVSP
jgi:plastocyanin